VWGILHVLALEPVGEPVQSQQLTPGLRQAMKTVLGYIHKAGYVHGDISLGNFCRRSDGMVFIVDLEKCRRCTNRSEMDEEETLIDLL
jgi:tRNA A-37 threonylcarbamoyl transferase component Bud32